MSVGQLSVIGGLAFYWSKADPPSQPAADHEASRVIAFICVLLAMGDIYEVLQCTDVRGILSS